MWGESHIDLFASRLNNQVQNYVSWFPDPNAQFVDACSLNWSQFEFIYVFAPFRLLTRCLQKILKERAHAVVVAPAWWGQPWASVLHKFSIQKMTFKPAKDNLIRCVVGAECCRLLNNSRLGISLLTRDIQGLNLPEEAVQIYLESWRPKTREIYLVYIKKWIQFCVERGLDYRCPEVSGVFLFLFQLFQKGYICSLWPLRALTFERLSKRMVMLFLLATSQRVQTLLTLKVTDIFWADNEQTVVFRLSELLKHHRRGSLGILTLKAFVQESKLCVVRCLKKYLQRSESLRGKDDPHLFVIPRKPFRPASQDTLARWVLDCMREAGIDTQLFKAHSVRGASRSKYSALNLPVSRIMEKADWKVESTFRKFYEKAILPKEDIAHKMLTRFIDKR